MTLSMLNFFRMMSVALRASGRQNGLNGKWYLSETEYIQYNCTWWFGQVAVTRI